MATDLDKALAKAQYTALPLPRAKSGPTTIFGFENGHLYIVRNQSKCLPDPPLTISPDPSADMLVFTKEFSFGFNAVVSFILRLFGAGNAKADLTAKRVKSATVQLGGLSHYTVETGALVDYLLAQNQATPCMRDITAKDHFTIIAALRAASFSYAFRNEAGATVKFTGPEANALFQVQADMSVSVTSEGKIVVSAPCYVGFIAWDGKRIEKELKKAKEFGAGKRFRGYTAPTAFALASSSSEIEALRLQSMKSAPRKIVKRKRGK
jgi:hypothetical protein